MNRRTGGCLCGAVRFTAEFTETGFLACHCTQCQRWTGGGPLYSIAARNVELTGKEHITEHEASHWGARGFCRICGSTLYWRMQDGDVESLAVGLLDDQSGLSLVEEIFIDTRPAWLPPAPGARQSTEAQEQAKLDEYLKTRDDT